LRASIYARGSRDDVDWDGKAIKEEKERKRKRNEMKKRWLSCKLFNWRFAPTENLKWEKKGEECDIVVWDCDTQSAVERVWKEEKGKKIAWLNLANVRYNNYLFFFFNGL